MNLWLILDMTFCHSKSLTKLVLLYFLFEWSTQGSKFMTHHLHASYKNVMCVCHLYGVICASSLSSSSLVDSILRSSQVSWDSSSPSSEFCHCRLPSASFRVLFTSS